jgi:hypothetical protein
VVDVTVRQQHGDGLQPVLPEHVVELVDDLDARVHHEALLTCGGREDVAVRAEGGGGEAGDQHERLSRSRPGGSEPTGGLAGPANG